MVRVRIAPSPTGTPHIGNTRTALFNYLFAKHNDGKFILRIEDTDRARFVPESEKAIYEILEWLGLNWDEEYKQSERLEIYKQHGEELLKKELAYKDEGAIRFKMPKTGRTVWKDGVGDKEITFENKNQEDFVIIKSDGFPTYNFANVIDDHLTRITHVFRGYEFIPSTPKHIQLYKAFNWEMPIFVHLPVILGPDHQKLSKRHGAKSVLDYRSEGYLKETLLNFMVLLGWNPGGDKEIMGISEMIKLFDLKDLNTASPVFDLKKLEWMNGAYIRKSQISDLKSQILAGNSKFEDIDEEILNKFIALAQTRMTTLNNFNKLTSPYFEKTEIKLSDREKIIAKKLLDEFALIKEWKNELIFSVIKKTMEGGGLKMPVMYKIITGKGSGLPLSQSLEIIGKQKTLEILKKND